MSAELEEDSDKLSNSHSSAGSLGCELLSRSFRDRRGLRISDRQHHTPSELECLLRLSMATASSIDYMQHLSSNELASSGWPERHSFPPRRVCDFEIDRLGDLSIT